MKRILTLLLVVSLVGLIGCNKPSTSTNNTTGSGKPITIAFMPKSKGNSFFISVEKGANKAATELGATLRYDGPVNPDPAKQNEIIENWITMGVDVIAAACENRD